MLAGNIKVSTIVNVDFSDAICGFGPERANYSVKRLD